MIHDHLWLGTSSTIFFPHKVKSFYQKIFKLFWQRWHGVRVTTPLHPEVQLYFQGKTWEDSTSQRRSVWWALKSRPWHSSGPFHDPTPNVLEATADSTPPETHQPPPSKSWHETDSLLEEAVRMVKGPGSWHSRGSCYHGANRHMGDSQVGGWWWDGDSRSAAQWLRMQSACEWMFSVCLPKWGELDSFFHNAILKFHSSFFF